MVGRSGAKEGVTVPRMTPTDHGSLANLMALNVRTFGNTPEGVGTQSTFGEPGRSTLPPIGSLNGVTRSSTHSHQAPLNEEPGIRTRKGSSSELDSNKGPSGDLFYQIEDRKHICWTTPSSITIVTSTAAHKHGPTVGLQLPDPALGAYQGLGPGPEDYRPGWRVLHFPP